MSKFFKIKAENSKYNFLLNNAYDALKLILETGYLKEQALEAINIDLDLYLSYKKLFNDVQMIDDINELQNKLKYVNSTDPQTSYLQKKKNEVIEVINDCIQYLQNEQIEEK